MLGPFKGLGSIAEEQNWALLRPLAAFVRSNARPIQGNRQYHRGATLGPFKAIGGRAEEQDWAHLSPSAAYVRSNAGPIQGRNGGLIQSHWQHVLGMKAIGNMSQ
ncbi:hypothetical protein EDB92DRAFT_1815431 [Lactarius akahatsu]|uniref:Uncharacterized protein n=1 Tax=Lactarius akahatsu TaxID=416441 RepID=A0AAD4LHW3_9AGAM|nr:hypothetical protein EDB92DRAFT_1815431 [Lactarius akahatsu]